VLAGGKHHPRLIGGNGGQMLPHPLPLLLAHPGAQDNEVAHIRGQGPRQAIEMIVALGQHER